jgi:hypothetical protein
MTSWNKAYAHQCSHVTSRDTPSSPIERLRNVREHMTWRHARSRRFWCIETSLGIRLTPSFYIREVSHQYENDNANEHVITLWIHASKSWRHLASFRSDKFVRFQTNMILLICFDMWAFPACKCYAIWLFEKELMTLSYSCWCETSLIRTTWSHSAVSHIHLFVKLRAGIVLFNSIISLKVYPAYLLLPWQRELSSTILAYFDSQ